MSKPTRTAIYLMVATLIAKMLGFVRELALGNFYGTSMYSDAYLVAMNIPTVLFAAVAAALSTTFIPLYCNIHEEEGSNMSQDFMNNIVNVVLIICSVMSILGIIYAEELVKIFAVGFKGERFKLATDFTRILMPSIIFIAMSKIYTSYLNIKNQFILPGLVSIPYNLLLIISIIISIRLDSYILAYGGLIAAASQVIFQSNSVKKNGYMYKFKVDIKDKNIKKLVILTAPVFIGVAVNQVNTMIDRALASTLQVGTISALNYANKLTGFVMGIFIASITTIVYPILSKFISQKNTTEFNKTITMSINSIILLIIPMSIGAMILSEPIVKILFERGAFDSNATQMTSVALFFYSIGMIGTALRDILAKIFYALQDTRTPMINGAIAMLLNIVLNVFLVKVMGIAGLALATSLSSITCVILLFLNLKKKNTGFEWEKSVNVLLKSIMAAIIMAIITKNVYNYTGQILMYSKINEIIKVIVSISSGALTYALMIVILKVEEVKIILNEIKSKINKL